MQRNESLIRLRNLIISLAVFVTLAFYASSYAEAVLRVSVMPDESPPVLRRKLTPLTDYLEKKIGMKMEFRPMLDGDALVQALVDHKLDLVWIDGVRLASAQTRSNGQVVPLVQRAGDETFPGHDDHAWAVRTDMDGKLRQELTNAFLSLNRNNGPDRNILDLQGARRFIPAEPPVRPGRPGP
ncbi:MAG: PhnD/SsuA/transferrin family substrate-binding protein [Gallionella sp.]